MNPLDCQQLLVISICEVHYCLNHISIYISIVYIRIRIYHSHPIHLPWISNYLVNIPFISKSYPTNTWYLIPTYPIFISQAKKNCLFSRWIFRQELLESHAHDPASTANDQVRVEDRWIRWSAWLKSPGSPRCGQVVDSEPRLKASPINRSYVTSLTSQFTTVFLLYLGCREQPWWWRYDEDTKGFEWDNK